MVSFFHNSGKYTVSINKWASILEMAFCWLANSGQRLFDGRVVIFYRLKCLLFSLFLQAVWLVTFTAVVILDVALGLLIGIVFSLYFVLRHSQK